MNVHDDAGAGRASDAAGHPLDELFEQLRHPVRRRILLALVERSPEETVDSGAFVTGPTPERERVALYHNHLPKLTAAGYVEWIPRTDAVARGPRFETIVPVVDLLSAYGDGLPGGWP